KGLNLVGLRRRLENREDVDALKHAYRELFNMAKPLQEAALDLYENDKNPYVKEMANFVLNTKRGIPFERKIKSENE
ncbi:MAG: acyl-[acyl-carrier-protein]--UDP-N-acetylglucosamine O-acyltransferase, partial [Aliarcobacter sp.]|nr:acyl-[acyl-carrier-protein]--UDP-N-acetylglucosamine O-acyltransferase [Aliarcobacter sp.]